MIPFGGFSIIVEDFLKDQSFPVQTTAPGLQMLGIRGARCVERRGELVGISVHSTHGPVTDRYDDVMFVWGRKRNGSRFSDAWPMSTEPGLASFRLGSYRRDPNWGAPVIQPGTYRYQRGLHRGKYKALRQAEPLAVIRDVDADAAIEGSDLWDYPRWTGINIHAGGRSGKVGYHSAGCQIIQGGWYGRPWRTFRDLVYEKCSQQDFYYYTMVSGVFLGHWWNLEKSASGQSKVKRLWYGSCGNRVTAVQERLMQKGYLARVEKGHFGVDTHQAVRRLQTDAGLVEDGSVGPDEYQKLGWERYV